MAWLLDGPIGTQLIARGVPAPAPLWSAWALRHRPELVRSLHQEYAAAGAQLHTANTFRTTRRAAGADWESLARLAVSIAGEQGRQVVGSIAPLEDCYRPERSPAESYAEHRDLAEVLVDAGCEVILVETFTNIREGLEATRAALDAGAEVWTSYTPGYRAAQPDGRLLSPVALAQGARRAAELGAQRVLVNCVPALVAQPYVEALVALGLPWGIYANAGHHEHGVGWGRRGGAADYAELALGWLAQGASVVGGCCGTGPAHTAELARRMLDKGQAG